MVNCNGNKEERRISERIYGNERRRDVKRRIIGEWLKILVGLTFFAYGVHLTICAGIGLSPWDCLGTGISYHTPLNYGMAMTWMSVLLIRAFSTCSVLDRSPNTVIESGYCSG